MIKTGTVVAVTPNTSFTSKSGKSFKVTELIYKDDDGKAQTERIFANLPFCKFVNGLQSGAKIELEKVKEGEFWKLMNVAMAGTSNVSGAPQASSAASAQSATPKANTMQNEEIRRSVALKASVEMRISDETIDDILRRAVVFEDYLAGKYEFLNKVEEMSENFVDDVGVE